MQQPSGRSRREMRPYSEYVEALVLENDPRSAMKKIVNLPLHKRYVWRVGQALQDALEDLQIVDIEVDRETLSSRDLTTLGDNLQTQTTNLCRFIESLMGPEVLERFIRQGIASATAELCRDKLPYRVT